MNERETYEAQNWAMANHKPQTHSLVIWEKYIAQRREELIQEWLKDNTPTQFRMSKRYVMQRHVELNAYVDEHLMDEVKAGRFIMRGDVTFNPSVLAPVLQSATLCPDGADVPTP